MTPEERKLKWQQINNEMWALERDEAEEMWALEQDEAEERAPLRKERIAQEAHEYAIWKTALFEKYGVTNNPKAEKALALALSEVEIYFSDFVELIK